MEEFKKKRSFYVAISTVVCSLLIITFIISYSYIDTLIQSNNDKATKINATTASNLEIIYTDCAEENEESCTDISKDLNLGESIEKTFQIKNNSSLSTKYNLYFKELQNTFQDEELVYKIENVDTGEILVNTTPIPYYRMPVINIPIKEKISLAGNTTHNYKMTITFLNKDYNQNKNLDAYYSIKISILPKNAPNFAEVSTTDEGIYAMEDDYGTSYYYRGAVENNYVKFGQDANGQEMWWRIIRFNGDGSIRMQYDGAGTAGTNTYMRGFALTNQVWNSKTDDAKYAGWMFGGKQGEVSTSEEEAQRNETSSEIKIAVDNWYKSNIVDTGYSKYVADAIFCNDRSTPGRNSTGWVDDTGLGYGKNSVGYGASIRTNAWGTDESNIQPLFMCPQNNDKFTVKESSGGNGALTYPVGLITADEIIAAGVKYASAGDNYLNKENIYWVFSPTYYYNDLAFVFYQNSLGLNSISVHSSLEVAPVINIKLEYLNQLKGRGTINNPYFLEK